MVRQERLQGHLIELALNYSLEDQLRTAKLSFEIIEFTTNAVDVFQSLLVHCVETHRVQHVHRFAPPNRLILQVTIDQKPIGFYNTFHLAKVG